MKSFGLIRIWCRFGLVLGIFALFSTQTVSAGASSVVIEGVSFSKEITMDQQTCKLIGVGVRKKFFVDVYLGALYLKTPTQNPQEVISSEQPKRVLLHVIYKQVDADKWVEGWKEGFQKSASNPDQALSAKIDQFLGFFKEPVKKGETVQISYIPGQGTNVAIKGQSKGTIPGADFMKALWSIWFGPEPASESLMKGMLGK